MAKTTKNKNMIKVNYYLKHVQHLQQFCQSPQLIVASYNLLKKKDVLVSY